MHKIILSLITFAMLTGCKLSSVKVLSKDEIAQEKVQAAMLAEVQDVFDGGTTFEKMKKVKPGVVLVYYANDFSSAFQNSSQHTLREDLSRRLEKAKQSKDLSPSDQDVLLRIRSSLESHTQVFNDLVKNEIEALRKLICGQHFSQKISLVIINNHQQRDVKKKKAARLKHCSSIATPQSASDQFKESEFLLAELWDERDDEVYRFQPLSSEALFNSYLEHLAVELYPAKDHQYIYFARTQSSRQTVFKPLLSVSSLSKEVSDLELWRQVLTAHRNENERWPSGNVFFPLYALDQALISLSGQGVAKGISKNSFVKKIASLGDPQLAAAYREHAHALQQGEKKTMDELIRICHQNVSNAVYFPVIYLSSVLGDLSLSEDERLQRWLGSDKGSASEAQKIDLLNIGYLFVSQSATVNYEMINFAEMLSSFDQSPFFYPQVAISEFLKSSTKTYRSE